MNIRLSNRSLSLRHRLFDEFFRFFDPFDDDFSVKIHPWFSLASIFIPTEI